MVHACPGHGGRLHHLVQLASVLWVCTQQGPACRTPGMSTGSTHRGAALSGMQTCKQDFSRQALTCSQTAARGRPKAGHAEGQGGQHLKMLSFQLRWPKTIIMLGLLGQECPLPAANLSPKAVALCNPRARVEIQTRTSQEHPPSQMTLLPCAGSCRQVPPKWLV